MSHLSCKLQLSRQKVSKKKRKVKNLKSALAILEKKHALSNAAVNHLNSITNPQTQEKLQRLSGTKCSEELRSFAITLQYYSTRAYEFVPRNILQGLPHPSTIRRWFATVDGSPGFSELAFTMLENKVQIEQCNGKQVIVALMMDCMSLRKQIEWDGKQYHGFVDIGNGAGEDDSLPQATEALTFLAVGVNGSWKVPLGYFLIAGVSGMEMANLVRIAIQKIHDAGARVISLTCDGPSAHFSMMKEVGATISSQKIYPFFTHPSNETWKIYVILDVSHMLKLVRNVLGRHDLIDLDRREISWRFIQALHKIQSSEGLRAGTRLGKAHIEWERSKVRVKLAAQTLSRSVADAIDFCREDLKLPEFEHSQATSEFLRVFDALFDVFNSKNKWGMKFKAPMQERNTCIWQPSLTEVYEYIAALKLKDSNHIAIRSKLKTGFIGFMTAIVTFQQIFHDLVEIGSLDHILSYKFSQDHVELLFCAIR